MSLISTNLENVRQRIHRAEMLAGRCSGSVTLVAVSKTQPAERLNELYELGQRDFAENYLQEATVKQQQLTGLDICWHFIGPVQSNKTRALAENFSWIHSVDRLKIAQRLSEHRPKNLPPLNLCLQINISGESSKSGIEVELLPELAKAVADLPRIRLRGLMAIPAPHEDYSNQFDACHRLALAMTSLDISGLDTLSMGMSHDMEAAIAAGATHVRIGTALFGERLPIVKNNHHTGII